MQLSDEFADLEKADHDIDWLMACFREVLAETGSADLADALPWQDTTAPVTTIPQSGRAIQSFAVAFQLLNLVEENASAQVRRVAEDLHGLASIHVT